MQDDKLAVFAALCREAGESVLVNPKDVDEEDDEVCCLLKYELEEDA